MLIPKRLLWVGGIFVLDLAVFVLGLGLAPFHTKGEPREALLVWEQIHGGTWILPLVNGYELPFKPLLFHWLAALTSLTTGSVDEFAVRLPSAVAAIATALLVFWLASEKWGTRAGVYASIALSTNFEWIRAARAARVDMVHTACLTAALVALDRIVSAPRPPTSALLVFYTCIGLAVLSKGPVAIALPALIALVYLHGHGDLGRVRLMRPLEGTLLVLAIAASWYVPAIAQGGRALLQLVIDENVLRFLGSKTPDGSHSHALTYYIPGFLAGFAPWSIFIPPLIVSVYRDRRHLTTRGSSFALTWFLVAFAFYSLSAGKRTVYILPLYPAGALLLGGWYSQLRQESRLPAPLRRTLQILALFAAAATLLVLLALAYAHGHLSSSLEWLRPLLHHRDQEKLPLVYEILTAWSRPLIVWAGLVTVATVMLALAIRRDAWPSVFGWLTVVAVGTAVTLNMVVYPELAKQRSVKPFMAYVRDAVGENDRLELYDKLDYGILFYARRHIPVVRELGGATGDTQSHRHVLLWNSQWKALPPEVSSRLKIAQRSQDSTKSGDPLLLAVVQPP